MKKYLSKRNILVASLIVVIVAIIISGWENVTITETEVSKLELVPYEGEVFTMNIPKG